MFTVQNQEETVQIGDVIRPIYIPSVTGYSYGSDRDHYYTGEYVVVDVRNDHAYPLPDGSEGVGTVAFIEVNQNFNATARKAFTSPISGDFRYYVSHFTILGRTSGADDLTADPVVELTEHEKEIERLKEINRVQMTRLNEMYANEEHNSQVLSENFRRLKHEHGWCDEANRVAQGIVNDFKGGLTIEAEEEYEVEVQVNASFQYTTTITVMAASREEAEQLFSDSPSDFVDEYSLNEAHSYEGWTDIEYEVY